MEPKKSGKEFNPWKFLFLGMCFDLVFGKSIHLLICWALNLPLP
jgi:hypothetical protein